MTISPVSKSSSKSLRKLHPFFFDNQTDLLFFEEKSATKPRVPDRDLTLLLPDSVILHVFALLPSSHNHISLVCRRWLLLLGHLRSSLRLLSWPFLLSGRVTSRFPNLTRLDLLPASTISCRPSALSLTHCPFISIPIDLDSSPSSSCSISSHLRSSDAIDEGLRALAARCPDLQQLAIVRGSESGLATLAAACPTIMELELHCCSDDALRAIAGYSNLLVLRVFGSAVDWEDSEISDLGLIILAHGCPRLRRLELGGSKGSSDGIAAIGECCLALEELTLTDHRMRGGWVAALPLLENLTTLRLQRCKKIDLHPELLGDVGTCPSLERVELKKCQLRDKQSLKALFTVCANAREIVFEDCWGLDNDMFSTSGICRRVKFLSLEGCSLITAAGLESVVLSWKELQGLKVVSCKSIRGDEVSPDLSSLFSRLQVFKWQPDSRSLLVSCFAGSGLRTRGGRFFRKSGHLNMLFSNAEYPTLLH